MIKVGGKNFKTKETLKNYCKYVLNTSEVGSILTGEWASVLKDVLKMHKNYTSKTKGCKYEIGVRRCNINPRNKQFFILREDGSSTDFSYLKAITQSSKLSEIKRSLRDAIKDQTIEFKENYFRDKADRLGRVECAETGVKIKKKESHVDHYPLHFDTIVKMWADKNNVSSKDLILTNGGDNSNVWEVADTSLLESFKKFHKEFAEYRIVLNKVNMQRERAARAVF